MPANGIILLGYARSAGSGDQPVPGTVTSRRDRGVQQKQKLKKQQEQEEERKVRQRQEVAAQYLKRKWKEEDDKKKRKEKDGVVEEQTAPERNESDDEEEEPTISTQRHVQSAPVGGQWVSLGGANNRILQSSSHAKETPRSANSGQAGSKEPERRGFLPAAPTQIVSMNPAMQQKRKQALASAFSLDDDDDGEARRELELAAKIKRTRVPAAGDSTTIGMPAPPGPAPQQGVDMYDQLRKLAEWKRKCKGNRIPMPDDLVKTIGKTAGLAHTAPQSTLGTSVPINQLPPSALRRVPSASRSRERERRRSRSRRKSR